jgi:hypothetical protein
MEPIRAGDIEIISGKGPLQLKGDVLVADDDIVKIHGRKVTDNDWRALKMPTVPNIDATSALMKTLCGIKSKSKKVVEESESEDEQDDRAVSEKSSSTDEEEDEEEDDDEEDDEDDDSKSA